MSYLEGKKTGLIVRSMSHMSSFKDVLLLILSLMSFLFPDEFPYVPAAKCVILVLLT